MLFDTVLVCVLMSVASSARRGGTAWNALPMFATNAAFARCTLT
jgi:hypothetical protein